jgi:hypothetical protein
MAPYRDPPKGPSPVFEIDEEPDFAALYAGRNRITDKPYAEHAVNIYKIVNGVLELLQRFPKYPKNVMVANAEKPLKTLCKHLITLAIGTEVFGNIGNNHQYYKRYKHILGFKQCKDYTEIAVTEEFLQPFWTNLWEGILKGSPFSQTDLETNNFISAWKYLRTGDILTKPLWTMKGADEQEAMPPGGNEDLLGGYIYEALLLVDRVVEGVYDKVMCTDRNMEHDVIGKGEMETLFLGFYPERLYPHRKLNNDNSLSMLDGYRRRFHTGGRGHPGGPSGGGGGGGSGGGGSGGSSSGSGGGGSDDGSTLDMYDDDSSVEVVDKNGESLNPKKRAKSTPGGSASTAYKKKKISVSAACPESSKKKGVSKKVLVDELEFDSDWVTEENYKEVIASLKAKEKLRDIEDSDEEESGKAPDGAPANAKDDAKYD